MMHISTNPVFRVLLAALFVTSVVACGDDDNDDSQNQNQNQGEELDPDEVIEPAEYDIEIAGNWMTQFDTREDIDDDEWIFVYDDNDDLAQEVIDFDNEERWAITKNPDDAELGPGTYNRSVWTSLEEDQFYYCTVDFGLDSEEEAHDSEETADEGDLDGGCGDGFSWTEMIRL